MMTQAKATISLFSKSWSFRLKRKQLETIYLSLVCTVVEYGSNLSDYVPFHQK